MITSENKVQKIIWKRYLKICAMKFNREPYLLNYNPKLAAKFFYIKKRVDGKKNIGLNTGCGKRWQICLWTGKYWLELIKKLQLQGYFLLLLGGTDKDEINKKTTQQTGAFYPGGFSLQEFIALTCVCDTVLTAVSMIIHIAIGLKKPLVLFNNIFNRHELYLYDNDLIFEPTSGSDDFYGNTCSRVRHCMKDIAPEVVYRAIHQVSYKS